MKSCLFILTFITLTASTLAAPPARRLVDGRYASVQLKLTWSDMIRVSEVDGKMIVRVKIPEIAEPLLRNWRTSLIEIEGSPLAWKMSCIGRVWNSDIHDEGTQHLQLIAAMDDAKLGNPMLTKIAIDPTTVSVQAVGMYNNDPKQVVVVFGPDFFELGVMEPGKVDANFVYRAPTARQMMRLHPLETRLYFLPTLRELAGSTALLAPAAGDVYRAFSDIPADPVTNAKVLATLPLLNDEDPLIRMGGQIRLEALGRKGMQSLLKLNRENLAPAIGDSVIAQIQKYTVDDRTASDLLTDRYFLEDCLNDSDPRIVTSAREKLKALSAPTTQGTSDGK